MIGTGAYEVNSSIERARKVCRFLEIAMKCMFAVFCVFWLFGIAWTLFSSIDAFGFEGSNHTGLFQVLSYALYGLCIAIIFIVIVRMFSDVGKGHSPFTLAQVKRLRIVSGALVVYAVIDVANASNSAIAQLGMVNSGYVSTTASSAVVMINFAPLIASAIIYAFSFVFKYGVLLQELSDETL